MTSAQKKAIKKHRSRIRQRGMKRVEIVVLNQDAGLVRDVAATLRRDDVSARKLRTAMRSAVGRSNEPSIADVLRSLPDISGPEFDAVFEEIERLRQHPIMKQVRDVEL
jgi:transposase-like protein